MPHSKHVWQNGRRGVLVACCNKSARICFNLSAPSQLLDSIGSFTKALHSKHEDAPSSSSSRLLQTIQDVGALHLHQQATPPVLDPHYLSDGISSCKPKPNGRDKRGLPSTRTRKASSVKQTVGDMCLGSSRLSCKHGSHQRDETHSAMPASSLEQNMEHAGAHRQWRSHKDEGVLHHHQSITQSYTSPLGSLEDMHAARLPQHDGKSEQAPRLSQKCKRAAKQTTEYWGSFLRLNGFLPASISNIVKSVPKCKRTQVNFENIVSLDLLLQTMDIDRDSIPLIIKKAPFMYQRNPVLHLEPKIAYLEMLGLHRTDMHRLVLKHPHALHPPIEDIQAQIQFLREIPLQHADVLTILGKGPTVFKLPADKYLRPKLEFFRRLGISEANIRTMLVGYPRVFYIRLWTLQKLARFMQRLGLQPGTSRFSWSLMTFGTSKVEVLQSRLERLANVGLSPEERPVREVVTYPGFLCGVSFDKRIRPRHEALVQWTAEKKCANLETHNTGTVRISYTEEQM